MLDGWLTEPIFKEKYMKKKVLKLEFEKTENNGTEIVFYFDSERVYSCQFLEEEKSFSHLIKVLEDFISGKSAKLEYGKDRSVIAGIESYIDVINKDVFLKFEMFQSHRGEYPNTKYDLDTTRFTLTEKDYEFINKEEKYVMEGNTKQIISEVYFFVLKYVANLFCNPCDDNNNWLQEYNDCKSIKIEEFLYPELKSYYSIDINNLKIHKKSQLITKIEICNDKSIEDIFEKRKSLRAEIELLYMNNKKEFIVLPVEEIKLRYTV